MSAKILNSKEFEEMRRRVSNDVTKMREEGKSNNDIRCWMVGYITGTDELENQLAFTARQLTELFSFTFD